MVFCTVHFKRGVDQAAGTNENLAIRKTMLSLLDATNRAHYFDILNAIQSKKYFLIHYLINIIDLVNILYNRIARLHS
jgi:hypothetical protein